MQLVKPLFCYLTYDSRTTNRTDSLYQTVNGLVGNVDWGESLTVVAYEFPGPNSFGARKRAASKRLAVELNFPKPSYQQMFEAFNLTQVFAVFSAILE